MQVPDSASDRPVRRSPEWVADWWVPDAPAEPPDVDLPALLVPEPVVSLEVAGRLASRERAASA